jgi:hypothetical protein
VNTTGARQKQPSFLETQRRKPRVLEARAGQFRGDRKFAEFFKAAGAFRKEMEMR